MWRIKHNKEIYDLFKEPKISTLVKLKRLQWAGYVQRMDEGRIPKSDDRGDDWEATGG